MPRTEDTEDLVVDPDHPHPSNPRRDRLRSFGRVAGGVRRYTGSFKKRVRKSVNSFIDGGDIDEEVDPWALTELEQTSEPWSGESALGLY